MSGTAPAATGGRRPGASWWAVPALCALLAGPAAAQSPAELYRRSPLSGPDPFARLDVPRWSLAVSGRAAAANSALTLDDLGAILFLAERDSLRVGDALDALGLVPSGEGISGSGDAGAGMRLGIPLGRVTLGLGLSGRAYGGMHLDDDAVALLRDGNAARSAFTLGRSRGAGLVTAEAGAHAVWRAGRVGGPPGPRLLVGGGLRLARPLYYARSRSRLRGGGTIRVTPDSVRARLSLEASETPGVDIRGEGVLADLMVRAEWPRPGAAVELSLTGAGEITVDRLVRRTESVDVATTRLETVVDEVEDLSLAVRDTVAAGVSPPAVAAATASLWSLAPVQLDARLAVPLGGDLVDRPAGGELLSTWRPLPTLPLRAGVRLGGHADVAWRVGAGWESTAFFVRAGGSTGGGLPGGPRGLSARLAAGLWL